MTPQSFKQSRWWLGVVLSVVGFALVGCRSTRQSDSGDPQSSLQVHEPINQPRNDERILRPGDVLSLTFTLEDARIPAFEGRIKEDGTITLQLIGEHKAVGKTSTQLKEEIRREYEKFSRVRAAPPTEGIQAPHTD